MKFDAATRWWKGRPIFFEVRKGGGRDGIDGREADLTFTVGHHFESLLREKGKSGWDKEATLCEMRMHAQTEPIPTKM